MSERDRNTFHTHDTGIFVHTGAYKPQGPLCIHPEIRDLYYEKLRGLLKVNGFSFHMNPETLKRYRCIAKYHHHGQRDDLQFKAEVYPVGFRIEFYQDIVHENPHGGRHDFGKRAKMPYLMGLRFEWIKAKIVAFLVTNGFECTDDPVCRTAQDRVDNSRRKSAQWHPFILSGPYQQCNITDADGNLLENGCVRYFRDYKGYLQRGRVFMGLNNCHNIVLTRDAVVWQEAAFRLFSWRPGLTRKQHPAGRRRLQQELERAVKAENFERAIVLRDLLRKSEQERRAA
jgi:hypothetical protein